MTLQIDTSGFILFGAFCERSPLYDYTMTSLSITLHVAFVDQTLLHITSAALEGLIEQCCLLHLHALQVNPSKLHLCRKCHLVCDIQINCFANPVLSALLPCLLISNSEKNPACGFFFFFCQQPFFFPMVSIKCLEWGKFNLDICQCPSDAMPRHLITYRRPSNPFKKPT